MSEIISLKIEQPSNNSEIRKYKMLLIFQIKWLLLITQVAVIPFSHLKRYLNLTNFKVVFRTISDQQQLLMETSPYSQWLSMINLTHSTISMHQESMIQFYKVQGRTNSINNSKFNKLIHSKFSNSNLTIQNHQLFKLKSSLSIQCHHLSDDHVNTTLNYLICSLIVSKT